MIQHGVRPRAKDHRDYSYHRTFGATVLVIPEEFDFDLGLTMPDQNADGYPQGCTAYTTDEMCSNSDGVVYDDHKYMYDNTLRVAGIFDADPRFEKVGVNVDDAFKAANVYGVKRKAETESQALSHLQGAHYDVLNGSGLDCFSSIKKAMWQNVIETGRKQCVSIGTPWLPEWHYPASGIIPTIFIYDPKKDYSWHNWLITGFKKINGVVYARAKTWQGKNYGDAGWAYYPAEIINKVLQIDGSFARMLGPYTGDVKTVKLQMLEIMASWVRILILRFKTMPQYTDPVVSVPPAPVSSPTQPSMTMLEKFCTAIRDNEGAPGDLNYRNHNPGNCRYSPVGYDPMYGVVKKDAKGFAIFKDDATGWLYLINFVKGKIKQHPTYTVLQFFAGVPPTWYGYAPVQDGNDPVKYAAFVSKQTGLSPTTPISQILA